MSLSLCLDENSAILNKLVIIYFYMSKHPYVINVKGRVISKVGNHYAQGYAARGIATFDGTIGDVREYTYYKSTHSIVGDLILDGTKRVPPYAIMSADGGIADLGSSNESVVDGVTHYMQIDRGITYLPGYSAALMCYRENMEQIKSSLSLKVDSRAESAYVRGLYVDAFSVIELFLGDFLLCGIFTDDNCYDRLLSSDLFDINDTSSSLEIETAVLSKIEETVFHNFNIVRKFFKRIIGFDLPDTTSLERLLHRRHNIVHRFSYSNIDRIRQCVPQREDVQKLIKECDLFVSQLSEKVRD